MHELVKQEIEVLKDLDSIHTGLSNTVLALRVLTNQAINAYITAGPEHGNKLLIRCAATVEGHFQATGFQYGVASYAPVNDQGKFYLLLDLAVRRTEEALSRGSVGDAKSQLMTILSIIYGCLREFGSKNG